MALTTAHRKLLSGLTVDPAASKVRTRLNLINSLTAIGQLPTDEDHSALVDAAIKGGIFKRLAEVLAEHDNIKQQGRLLVHIKSLTINIIIDGCNVIYR
jgi:hypothetical protein